MPAGGELREMPRFRCRCAGRGSWTGAGLRRVGDRSTRPACHAAESGHRTPRYVSIKSFRIVVAVCGRYPKAT
jgi:hypothetical protein